MSNEAATAALLAGVYDRDDPHRPIPWRLLRVQQLMKSDIPPDEFDDKWILRLLAYLRQRDTLYAVGSACPAKLHRAVRKLAADFKEIHYAMRMYEQNERTGRWLLEAMLSIRDKSREETVAIVADRMGVTRHVIYAYSMLFFDVSDRINKPYWSYGTFLAQLFARGVGEMDMDQMWKASAFFYGIDFLMHLVSIEHLPDDIKVKFENMLRSAVLRRALVGVVCRAPSAYGTAEMIQAHNDLSARASDIAVEDDGTAARALLSRVSYSVRAVVGIEPTKERKELRSGSELVSLIQRGVNSAC